MVRFTAAASLLWVACATPFEELEQGVEVCPAGPLTFGIDVSRFQGTIDWPAVAADGVEFAIIRVSDGTQTPDERFAENWQGAADAGVLRGAYQFFRPQQDPIAQADLLLDAIGTLGAQDLSPVIDIEDDDGATPAQIAAAAQAWIDRVSAATGRVPIVYTGRFFWEDFVGNADFSAHPLWHAQYPATQPPPADACPNIASAWPDWALWQYTDMGAVDGIVGNVDLNRYNGTRDDLLAQLTGDAGECGDGACTGAETFATCPTDCAPCGVLPAAGGVIDDGDACFATFGPAASLRAVSDAGEGGDLIWTHTIDSSADVNYATWTVVPEVAGTYRVEAYTAAAYAESVQAPYQLRLPGRTLTIVADQTEVDGWLDLGNFAFEANTAQVIYLGDNTGEPGASEVRLVFDAVRLTPVDGPPDPPNEGGCCSTGDDRGASNAAIWIGLGAVWFGRRRRARRGAA